MVLGAVLLSKICDVTKMLRHNFVTPSFVSFMIRIINDTKIITYDNFSFLTFSESSRSIPALLTRTIKSTKIIYLMYKNKDYLGFYNNNNSVCNRCELAGVRNSFLTPALRLDRIETVAQSGTAIVVIVKITEGNLSFYSTT